MPANKKAKLARNKEKIRATCLESKTRTWPRVLEPLGSNIGSEFYESTFVSNVLSNVLAKTKNENGGDVEVKHRWVVSRALKYLYIKLWKSKLKKVEKVGEKYTQCATVKRSYKWPLNNHFKNCIYLVCSSTALCTLRLEHSLVRKYRFWVYAWIIQNLGRQLQLEVSELQLSQFRRTISASAFRDCGNQVYTLIKREGRMFLFAWLIMLGPKGLCLLTCLFYLDTSFNTLLPSKAKRKQREKQSTSLILSLSSRPQCIPRVEASYNATKGLRMENQHVE